MVVFSVYELCAALSRTGSDMLGFFQALMLTGFLIIMFTKGGFSISGLANSFTALKTILEAPTSGKVKRD